MKTFLTFSLYFDVNLRIIFRLRKIIFKILETRSLKLKENLVLKKEN